MADLIQFRRDTAARWEAANPTLAEGELGLVLGTANQYKVGDGVTAWNDLPLKGFNGNILDEFGENYDGVISQGGLTALMKNIVNNGSHINISGDWTVLDDLKNASDIGLYILTNNSGATPLYHMFITGDNNDNNTVNQWIIGNLTIDSDGKIRGTVNSGSATIVVRSYSEDGIWSKWEYLQQKFIKTYSASNTSGEVGGDEYAAGYSGMMALKTELTTAISGAISSLNKSLSADISTIESDVSALQTKFQTLNARADDIEDIANAATSAAEKAQDTADNNTAVLYETKTVRFDGFIEDEDILQNITTDYTGVYYDTVKKVFAALGSDDNYYSRWGNDDEDNYVISPYVEDNEYSILKDKIYIYDTGLYIWSEDDDNLIRVDEKSISLLEDKVGSVVVISGIISNGGSIPTVDGNYFQKDSKNKITTIIFVEDSGNDTSTITPTIGQLFVCDGLFYGWNGKQFQLIGGGSGSGSGSGFYNVTKEIPLDEGYYTLSTALAAIQDAEAVDTDDMLGKIITIETAAGVWSDYRFAGTSTSSFYEVASWEEYGAKGVVKKITLQVGTNTPTETEPDGSGNVTLNVPAVEVDETIDENSTNPVQNKTIAAEFKNLAGKYGTQVLLNTIEEGSDKAYSLSLLDENGNVLSTTETFTGGGSGGTSLGTKVVLTRIDSNPTVKYGDTVKLRYKYDQINTDTQESTGESAKVTVTISRGATSNSYTETVAAGSTVEIDATKYLGIGTNTVKVRAVVGEGDSQQVSSVSWAVSVVQLTLTSSFNIGTLVTKGTAVSVPYALTGSGNKTLRCYVDGVDTEDRSITSSSSNGSFSIDTSSMSHGAHSVQLVAELELTDGTIIKSNSIYFGIAVRVVGNTTPIIATKFEYNDGTIITAGGTPYISVEQYENYSIIFAAYNPNETPTTVKIYELGSLLSSSSVSFVLTKLEFRAMSYGTENCQIVCGSTTFDFNLISSQSDLDLSEPTDNMTLKLSAQGRSNSDTNKDEWTYGDTTTDLTDFNWGGDGWTGTTLCLKGNARAVVNFKPFEQPDVNINNALAFMMKFKVSEVSDYDAEIVKCMDDNGTGFVITPSNVKVVSRGNSEVSMQMAVDNVYEVAIVSFPEYTDGASDYEKQNSNMLYLYINGIIVGGVQRGDSDNIYQASAQNITLGSDSATLDVYLIRAWNNFLTDSQVLSCYILDQDSVDDLLSLYNENDILDDNGEISVDSVQDGTRCVIITGAQTSGQTTVMYAAIQNNKKTKYDVDEILTFIKGEENSEKNFRLVGGCISLQGTSSLAYPIKNYRIYLYNKNKVNGQLYLGCNEQGVGGTLQSVTKYSFRPAGDSNYAAIPVNCFCLKADFAESSSSHNTGMARLVHTTLMEANELSPAQANVDRSNYQYDVRTTIDGEPCLLFYRATVNDTPKFLGKFNWNNDKSTEDVFGFKGIPGYHDADWVQSKFGGTNPTECWEFLNNDYKMGMFLDDDFDTMVEDEDGSKKPNWLNVFEARFPDDDDINAEYEAGTRKPTYLEPLVKWVKSTDTTEDGLTATEIAARQQTFKDELANYFDVDYLCDYYIFTDLFACVDQRVKNMMMAFWYNPDKDKVLAYMIFYDNDTILGVRNDGRLKYDWDINEETTDPELSTDHTVYAYAGHDSVLWKNLRECFADELGDAYRRIRNVLTNSDIFDFFDTQQSDKFCARIYNLDAINKYISPKTVGVEVIDENTKQTTTKLYSYLESMQGDRKSQRHYFIANRCSLFDARYSTGNYTSTDINWKGNSAAGATVTAVAAREFYFEFRREGTSMTRSKVVEDQEWSYTYSEVANVGTIFHLYGGEWMKKLDLASWGGFTDLQIPKLPVLEELILGKTSSSYSLSELVIGSNLPMLKKLVMVNYTQLPSLNLSSCVKLEYLDAGGCTNLSTITFAESAPLSYFHIPLNYQTLTLKSLPLITRDGLVFDNINNITNLWVEKCNSLDGFALFQELFALSSRGIKNVRLTELSLEGDGEDLRAWYEAGIGGLDSSGNIISNHCKICGDYQLTSYLDDETFETYQEYFNELNIKQPQYTIINSDDTVSDDINFSNPDNKTGYDYDNDYVMSGHIKKIWNKRHGYLGKQTEEGTMLICQLNDSNFNYFSDGATVATSTSATLDSTQGDAFIKEPHYWYKGINDIFGVFSSGASRKYYCWSSNEAQPDVPTNFTRLTLDDIKNLGNYRKGYKVQLGLSDLESSITSDSNYSYLKVDISGYKYVRFPIVLGPLVGAIITDADGTKLEEVNIASLDAKMVNGMYVIYEVPEDAKILHMSIYNSVDWDDVILSNATKVEDLEPDWVEHEECLVGMFEAITVGSALYSACGSSAKAANNQTQPTFSAYAAQRKLQLIDWEMHKDVGNLFYGRYGRRNSQKQCGYGQSTNVRIIGSSAFLGMTDTVNKTDSTTEYAWYTDENGDLQQISCSRFGGYENWWGNVAEWMDKVYLYSTLPYTFQIEMPDGTTRNALASSASGNYIKYLRHQKYMDLINVSNDNSGTQNTYYCDQSYIAGGNQVVYRSHYYAYAYGGVSCAHAGYGSTFAYTGIGCRLAFRGTISEATSVSAFLAATAKY